MLGVSREAVRKRVKRGTLRSDKDSDGRVYVYLPVGPDAGEDAGGERDDNVKSFNDPRDELIEELRDRVRALEEANRETRRLLAGALERIPAIESPEATEPSSDAAPPQSHTNTPEQEREPETAPERRGWFRRFFGFD